jgi:hypothetical protein
VPGLDWTATAHSLLGAMTLGAVLDVALFAAWRALFAPLLQGRAPAAVRGRLAAAHIAPTRIAALTQRLPLLTRDYFGMRGAWWAQYASSMIGVAVLGWVLIRWYRATTPIPCPGRPALPRPVAACLLLVLPVVAALLGGAVSFTTSGNDPVALRTAVVMAAIRGGTFLLVALVIAGTVHATVAGRDSMGA